MMAVEVDQIREEQDLNGLENFDLAIVAQRIDQAAILAILAEHEEPFVRAAVCDNPNITPELIRKLQEDPNEHVRNKASKLTHPDLTEEIAGVRSRQDKVLDEE